MDIDKEFVRAVLRAGKPAVDSVGARLDGYLYGDPRRAWDFLRGYVADYGDMPSREIVESKIGISLDGSSEGSFEFFLDELQKRKLFQTTKDAFKEVAARLEARDPVGAADAMILATDGLRTERERERSNGRGHWYTCRDAVPEILARRNEPWISLKLGGRSLCEVRPGGAVLLIAPTGAGKTSLSANIAREHALAGGNAVVASLELPADEWVARVIGVGLDLSWPDVLRGHVLSLDVATDERIGEVMRDALPERLAIIPTRVVTPDIIERTLASAPPGPTLLVVDYVQIFAHGAEIGIRERVGWAMRALDDIARKHRCAVLVLSQGSRSSSRDMRDGKVIGRSVNDMGAETADLERWATLTIGVTDSRRQPDGTTSAMLSVGKSRMSADEDRVYPAMFDGRSGRWRLVGAPVTGAQAKANSDARELQERVLDVEAIVRAAPEPISQARIQKELKSGIRAELMGDLLRAALAAGIVCRVEKRLNGMRNGQWPYWTRQRAAQAGLAIVDDNDDTRQAVLAATNGQSRAVALHSADGDEQVPF